MTYVLIHCTYDYYQFDEVVCAGSKADLDRYIKEHSISPDDVFEQAKLTEKQTYDFFSREREHYRIITFTKGKRNEKKV